MLPAQQIPIANSSIVWSSTWISSNPLCQSFGWFDFCEDLGQATTASLSSCIEYAYHVQKSTFPSTSPILQILHPFFLLWDGPWVKTDVSLRAKYSSSFLRPLTSCTSLHSWLLTEKRDFSNQCWDMLWSMGRNIKFRRQFDCVTIYQNNNDRF